MYSIAGYGQMLSDHRRVRAYSDALERAITPGCTVLDIGTGSGFFALLACRLGANKVYAIEPDEIVQVARTVARDNGYADRITFFQELSTSIDLPEQVDVVVSDLRTVVPWFQQHVATIEDARRRFLKPGGVLIPERDDVYAAVVEAPDAYATHVGHQPQDTAGFDMAAARRLGSEGWAKTHVEPEQLLTEPLHWATLDYRTITYPGVDADLRWIVQRQGTAHGIALWFDATLLGEIGFSNAPGAPPMLYGNAFFPLRDPVAVQAGDMIDLKLRADLAAGDYLWRWVTSVSRPGTGTVPITSFAQNNFSALRTMRTVRSRGSSCVPAYSEQVAIDRTILECVDGSRSLRAIAEVLADRYPTTFPSWEDALESVAAVTARYLE
jgi:protein arginine N-methyltransferase 1